MIRTTFSDFSAYITIVFLATVFILWILSDIVHRLRHRQKKKFLLKCDLCGFVFTNPTLEKFSKCPHCGRMNERQSFLEI